jgi:centromere protein C
LNMSFGGDFDGGMDDDDAPPSPSMALDEEDINGAKKKLDFAASSDAKHNDNDDAEDDADATAADEVYDDVTEADDAKPASPAPKPKKKAKRGSKRRRNTLKIVERGLAAGILDSDSEDDGAPRRSSRRRVKPVAYWKLDHVNYAHEEKFGITLSTVREEEPVITQKSPTPKPRRRRSKTHKKKRRKVSSEDDSEDEAALGLPKGYEYDAFVDYEDDDGEVFQQRVVRHFNEAKRVTLENVVDGVRIPDSRVPQFTKSFNTPFFTAGMILIPAGGRKFPDTPKTHQVFHVSECTGNGVLVKIGSKEIVCSKHSQFFVSAGETYEIVNRSKNNAVKIAFTLIKNV